MKNKLFTNKKGLLVVLSAAMAMTFTACGSKETTEEPVAVIGGEAEDLSLHTATELGEGDVSFAFTVAYESGTAEDFIINTNAATVGEALIENGLIEGEDGEWGMMVTAVRGVVADYEATGTYWAFYEDGEYAMTGVESTEIVEGTVYTFAISE